MFHVKHPIWEELASQLGLDLSEEQYRQLAEFRDWLAREAVPAGGLGPSEIDRLEGRHIADSLLFVAGFSVLPSRIRDLGSGVGLPGIPLAIAYPEVDFELIDRSGRRLDLMRRACRILDLPNVSVVSCDIERVEGTTPGIVSRASLSPQRMAQVANRQLEVGGVAVMGGSWAEEPRYEDWETKEVVVPVLDQVVWLLIMRRQ